MAFPPQSLYVKSIERLWEQFLNGKGKPLECAHEYWNNPGCQIKHL